MTTVDPVLSVIVLSYNTRDLTLACLRALDAAAAGLETEIIVVDNASTDNTVSCLTAEFPRVRVIANHENVGFARGNNLGLAAASGRYRLVLNSDTVAQPGALRVLAEFMDAHPEAGACGPQLLNPDGTLQPSGRDLPSLWSVFAGMSRLYRLWRRDFYEQRGRDYTQVARVQEVSGAALLVRREAYERTGGFDPRFFAYYEDVDWCKRLGEAGYAIYYVPHARVRHLWHGSSRQESALASRAAQDSLRLYFARHHGPLAHAAIRALLAAKEAVLLVQARLRRDRAATALHRALLRSVWMPLPASTD